MAGDIVAPSLTQIFTKSGSFCKYRRALYLYCFRPFVVRSCLELFCFLSFVSFVYVICAPVLTEGTQNRLALVSFQLSGNLQECFLYSRRGKGMTQTTIDQYLLFRQLQKSLKILYTTSFASILMRTTY